MSVNSMRAEKLHAEFFGKMQEEQHAFVENLKTKTTGEIVNYAYESLIHENFLDEMELINLTERQIREMLATENLLAYLYRNGRNPKTLKRKISSVSSKTILQKNKRVRGSRKSVEAQGGLWDMFNPK